jgi:hypothetical protein
LTNQACRNCTLRAHISLPAQAHAAGGQAHQPPETVDLVADLAAAGWRAVVRGSGLSTARCERTGVQVISAGRHRDRHGDNLAAWLLASYQADGRRFASDLNGSFLVLILDPGLPHLLAVTDPLGSRRLFYRRVEGATILSTSLRSMEAATTPLDEAAIGFYLAAGSFMAGRTPYAGILAMPRATVFAVSPAACAAREYWRYPPDGPKLTAANEAEERIERIVVRSVSDALAGGLRPAVSLSGGLDSTCLLGVLRNRLGLAPELFTYCHGKPAEADDAAVAARTARALGLQHRTVEAYGGRLIRHIERNAEWGEGWACHCSEIDAWWTLATDWAGQPARMVFTGDQSFINWWRPLREPEDLLLDASLAGFGALHWSEGLFGRALHRRLGCGCTEIISEILARLDGFDTLMAAGECLYLDQRMPNTYMAWRDRFVRRAAETCAPLVDRELYEVTSRLAPELKMGRRVFADVAARFWPQGMPVRAASGAYAPDWHSEIVRNADGLAAWVSGTSSRLDELIPRHVALGLVRHIRAHGKPKTDTERWMPRIARGSRDWSTRLRGLGPFHRQLVYPHTLLIRLLTLRAALRTG